MIRMDSYKAKSFIKALGDFRSYEADIKAKWGGRKRLFKCVDTALEIKFCKAEMLFEESLIDKPIHKKIEMIDMMTRAYKALIAKAESNGHKALDAIYSCYKYGDGIAIVCTYDSEIELMKTIHGKDKYVTLWSMQEIFRIITPGYTGIKEAMKKNGIDGTFTRVNHK